MLGHLNVLTHVLCDTDLFFKILWLFLCGISSITTPTTIRLAVLKYIPSKSHHILTHNYSKVKMTQLRKSLKIGQLQSIRKCHNFLLVYWK